VSAFLQRFPHLHLQLLLRGEGKGSEKGMDELGAVIKERKEREKKTPPK